MKTEYFKVTLSTKQIDILDGLIKEELKKLEEISASFLKSKSISDNILKSIREEQSNMRIIKDRLHIGTEKVYD